MANAQPKNLSRQTAGRSSPYFFKTPIWLVLLTIAGTIVYRHLTAGPHIPIGCLTLGYQCPAWPISGTVSEGFGKVRDEFRRNFEDGDEVGASFFAWMDGKPVVELTGGFFDKTFTKPYPEDVLQLVFSSSKAVAGIAVANMVSKGALSYSDRIAQHWPEFAAGNKENVTIADLLSHRAGVSYLDASRAPTPDEILDLDTLSKTLAEQPHNFGGKTTVGYHAVTRGWYLNELVRRSDPKNRTLGQYIREEISDVLGIDYHLGLDEALHKRVSPLVSVPPLYFLYALLVPTRWQKEPVPPMLMNTILKPQSVSAKALVGSGPKVPWYEMWPKGYNRPEVWRGESGSFSGMTNARSLARLAAVMANGGTDPVTKAVIIDQKAMTEALTPMPVLLDHVIGYELPYVTGGWGALTKLVHGETWVGWSGAGGSMIWWNQEENLAFGYAMNAVKLQGLGDKRSWRLIKAFLEAVDVRKGRTSRQRIIGDGPVEAAAPPV